MYLRHLGEQADGRGQREAERNQANEAVDGQPKSAVSLQEWQPARVDTQEREGEAAAWIDPAMPGVIFGPCAGLGEPFCSAEGWELLPV